MVRTLKAATTREVRRSGLPSFAWQRNYFERVIRGEPELARAREYIALNPARWAMDRENPARR